MAVMNKPFYVIILDGDINQDTWDFIAKRDSLPNIRKVTEYLVSDKKSWSKSKYDGVSCKIRKTIINTETQDEAKGEVYKLTKK
jgi:hypothetical protein